MTAFTRSSVFAQHRGGEVSVVVVGFSRTRLPFKPLDKVFLGVCCLLVVSRVSGAFCA
jgi:hypothetical protein